MLLGRNLGTFNLTPDELEFVKSGFSDMVLKKEHQVDLDKYGPKVDALARKRGQERVAVEKEQLKTFLDKAGREAARSSRRRGWSSAPSRREPARCRSRPTG